MRTLLCLLSLLLLSTQAHAENRFGVLGGVNLAKFVGDAAVDQGFGVKTGMVEGIAYQRGLDNGLYLEGQLRYIQRGGRLGTERTTLGYLNIPVYAKYKFMEGQFFKPFVFGGPSFNVKTDAKIGTRKGSVPRQQFSAFDVSLDAGLGFDLAVSQTIDISLSGAYNFGFINLPADVLETSLAGRSLKNAGINIYAGASWKL